MHKVRAIASPSSHQLRREDAYARGRGGTGGVKSQNTVYVEKMEMKDSFVTDVETESSRTRQADFPPGGH